MLIQPYRTGDVQRTTKSSISIRNYRLVGVSGDHLRQVEEFRLGHHRQIWLTAVGACRTATSEVEEVEADLVRDSCGDAIEDTGSDETSICCQYWLLTTVKSVLYG